MPEITQEEAISNFQMVLSSAAQLPGVNID